MSYDTAIAFDQLVCRIVLPSIHLPAAAVTIFRGATILPVEPMPLPVLKERNAAIRRAKLFVCGRLIPNAQKTGKPRHAIHRLAEVLIGHIAA